MPHRGMYAPTGGGEPAAAPGVVKLQTEVPRSNQLSLTTLRYLLPPSRNPSPESRIPALLLASVLFDVAAASRRRPPLQKKVGAGMTVEEFRAQVAAGTIKHHGLPESVAMIADSLGLCVERIEETIDPVVATETVRSEYLEVPAGRAASVISPS